MSVDLAKELRLLDIKLDDPVSFPVGEIQEAMRDIARRMETEAEREIFDFQFKEEDGES